MTGVAVKTVELRFPFSEIDVNTGLRKTVVALDRAPQLHRIDANRVGEFVERTSAREITAVDEFSGIAVARIDNTEAVHFEEDCITD